MTENEDNPSQDLDLELARLLERIEREPVPDRLLRRARELQAALDARPGPRGKAAEDDGGN